MQIFGGHPPELDFDAIGVVAGLDREIARRNREIAVKTAVAEIRASIEDKRVKAWMDHLDTILGPEPTEASAWASRGELLLRMASIQGLGIDPSAARAYAQECARRAAWLDPKKYGPNPGVGDEPPADQALLTTAQRIRAMVREMEAKTDGTVDLPVDGT